MVGNHHPQDRIAKKLKSFIVGLTMNLGHDGIFWCFSRRVAIRAFVGQRVIQECPVIESMRQPTGKRITFANEILY